MAQSLDRAERLSVEGGVSAPKDLVADLAACALIEAATPTSVTATIETKAAKQRVLDELERLHTELKDHMWWERTSLKLQEQRNAAYDILERWLAIFEAAGAPFASGDPDNHPILSVMGDTRSLLRNRPACDETLR